MKNRQLISLESYDAAEDNELSFREGDRVTDIDRVDDDWWKGKANGREGLFPGEQGSTFHSHWNADEIGIAAYVVPADEYQPS